MGWLIFLSNEQQRKSICVVLTASSARATATSQSNPSAGNPSKHLSSSRPKTCQRIRDERQPNLGRETTESGSRDERIWDEKRMCNVPRSTKSIAFVCLHSYEQPKGSQFHHHLTLNTLAFLTSFLNSVINSSLKFNTKIWARQTYHLFISRLFFHLLSTSLKNSYPCKVGCSKSRKVSVRFWAK